MEMKYLKYSSSSLVEEKCKDKKPMFKDNSSSELFQFPSRRNYTCSFCKREFKSAQALGGHMNVHRRERAGLRQLPSWILQFHNPRAPSEPNPTRHCSHPPSPPTLFSPMDRRDRIDFPDEGSGNVVREEGIHIRIEDEIKRKGKYARLNLKMGLEMGASDSNLDLELRLGNL